MHVLPSATSPGRNAAIAYAVPAAGGRVGSPLQLFDPVVDAAALIQIGRDGEIIAQGARRDFCYQIVSGCVRTVTLLEDGRRQVGAFLLPGDVFGWEMDGEERFAAEAVTPVALRRLLVGAVWERAAADRAFGQTLRGHMLRQMAVLRDHTVLLGRKTAAERIGRFLLTMEALLAADGGFMELPMSRTDIADYLGLTIETVCRGISELRRQGVIGVERTRIVILDRRGLA